MKKAILLILILSFIMTFAGCETLQRKFTRKRKKVPIRPIFYAEDTGGETRPNLELYMMHYMYWKTWHEELVNNAGVNAKKDRLACREVIGNLLDMKKRLKDKRAKELDLYIAQIKEITDEITSGGSTTMRLGLLKKRLDDIRARIVRKFYYKKIRGDIKPD